MALLFLLAKQLFSKPPYPETDFTGKTVVVTGSNTGLGKEAVRHFARLNAKEVIIAVRSVPKGEQARKEIEADLNPEGTISVWELDYGNYDSVKAFAKRAAELDRIDAVVLNAAVAGAPFQRFEGEESQIVVNVISTMLLAVLLVPILRQVASRHHIVPTISITSSEVHAFATGFPERNAENIFMALNDEKKSNMMLRYPLTKLLEVYAVRELADRTSNTNPFVVMNIFNPGFCYSDLTRHAQGSHKAIMSTMKTLFAYSTEEGARSLVHAAAAGPQSHGVYMTGCQVHNSGMAPAVTTAEGRKIQTKVWNELVKKLEKIQPGSMADL